MGAALNITLADVEREAIRRGGFAEFVRRSWSIVEPTTPLLWNWHLDAMCSELEAVGRGEIRDLVINVPPGCSKSLFASVLWPAYRWTQDPGHRFIVASHNDRVVLRDAEKMRELVKSVWYQSRWPEVRIPAGKAQSDAVTVFRTTAGGMRYSATVRGKLTGEHCDTFIVDDPIDPMGAEAASGIELDEVLDWWAAKVQTRFRNHSKSARLCIMQRVNDRDLAGKMIEDGARVLCLPMRFDSGHPNRWSNDPRKVDGELLDPGRVPEDAVRRLEQVMGPTRAGAQFGQRPTPKGGGIFHREWFQFWTELPKTTGVWTISVDCTFKKTDDGSFVVIQVWLQCGPNFYLVDQVRERLSLPETIDRIMAFVVKYPRAIRKLVEDKANGPAVVDSMKRAVPGLELVTPDGGKEARAYAAQPLVSGGYVFVPDPKLARYQSANDNDGRVGASWVDTSPPGDPTPGGFLGEVTRFPKAATDDQVDTMTQFLNYATPRFATKFAEAMEAIRKRQQGAAA